MLESDMQLQTFKPAPPLVGVDRGFTMELTARENRQLTLVLCNVSL